MQISEIRVKLVGNRTDRLKAFCSVTFDNMFVVRDLKIIEGADGYFVAMPSRKLTDRCPSCGSKNTLRSRFCSDCGARLGENRARSTGGRTKLHADVAHPVNSQSREYIQGEIIKAYKEEVERSKRPGYKPIEDDYDYDEDTGGYDHGSSSQSSPSRSSYGSDQYHSSSEPSTYNPDDTSPPSSSDTSYYSPPPSTPPDQSPEKPQDNRPDSSFSDGIF